MAINEPGTGELNRRIMLRRRGDLPAADGGLSSLFSDERKRWARIEPVGTAIYSGSVQADNKITHRITLRYLGVVPTDFEVLHTDVVYRVKRATDLNGRHRFTVLEVEELGQQQVGGGLYG
ncbi:head-tail adaptor protein [Pseudomonas sp. LP_7_YM]|uniref:head-tail adaptor protein n=1 Tax=Pseudomonas sp. LP_7_YM TaxID=2485137 RepID=UPI00106095E7|nr:head-tail adaptor protein [Pseudomonas sp. LP_7_YM]TDV60129.1 head-tail adaptor [Pseudomonas sp. LP_7_YM]